MGDPAQRGSLIKLTQDKFHQQPGDDTRQNRKKEVQHMGFLPSMYLLKAEDRSDPVFFLPVNIYAVHCPE